MNGEPAILGIANMQKVGFLTRDLGYFPNFLSIENGAIRFGWSIYIW